MNKTLVLSERVNESIGKAIEVLYNLDIFLSNGFFGNGGKHDRAIHKVRRRINKAMHEIRSEVIFPLVKDIG